MLLSLHLAQIRALLLGQLLAWLDAAECILNARCSFLVSSESVLNILLGALMDVVLIRLAVAVFIREAFGVALFLARSELLVRQRIKLAPQTRDAAGDRVHILVRIVHSVVDLRDALPSDRDEVLFPDSIAAGRQRFDHAVHPGLGGVELISPGGDDIGGVRNFAGHLFVQVS
ncbi:hypothetical protein A5699_17150 [Mycobacterium sp. E802]|nr:hypothetical protein A5699_17150 [Mycobacterium sp. E802]